MTKSRLVITSVSAERRSTSMCMEVSRSHMVSTSAMRGTLDSTYSPSASTVAAISLRAEFLAPDTRTEPSRGPPGRTMTRLLTAQKYYAAMDGRPPQQTRHGSGAAGGDPPGVPAAVSDRQDGGSEPSAGTVN